MIATRSRIVVRVLDGTGGTDATGGTRVMRGSRDRKVVRVNSET